MVASPHGRKWSCHACECKFYDLNRKPPTCPKCGANQNKAPRRSKAADIAAKILAATVTETEENESGGPVADSMDVFEPEAMEGSEDDDDVDEDEGF